MKIHCHIIKDLIPLYVEDMLSAESVALTEEHLKECETCRQEADAFRKNSGNVSSDSGKTRFMAQADEIRQFKKKLRTRKIIIIIMQAVLILVLLTGLIFGSWACDRLRPVEIDYGSSKLHSLDDRKAAVTVIRESMEKTDRKVYSISYAGDAFSQERADSYEVAPEDVIVFRCVYRASSCNSVPFFTKEYEKGLVLQREENEDWSIHDSGYWELVSAGVADSSEPGQSYPDKEG